MILTVVEDTADTTGLDSPKLSQWRHDLRVNGGRTCGTASHGASCTNRIVNSVLSYYSWYGLAIAISTAIRISVDSVRCRRSMG